MYFGIGVSKDCEILVYQLQKGLIETQISTQEGHVAIVNRQEGNSKKILAKIHQECHREEKGEEGIGRLLENNRGTTHPRLQIVGVKEISSLKT